MCVHGCVCMGVCAWVCVHGYVCMGMCAWVCVRMFQLSASKLAMTTVVCQDVKEELDLDSSWLCVGGCGERFGSGGEVLVVT